MKTMSKLFAMVLALAMVLAMATTVFAVEGGSLEVTGAENSTVSYQIYKVCDVEVVEPGQEATYKYKLADGWEEFVDIPEFNTYFTANETNGEIYLNWNSSNASAADGAAVAQLAKAFVEAHSIASIKTVTVNDGPVDLADDGYYLLVPDNGTTCGVVVVADEKKVIQEKSTAAGLPTVIKKVLEDSTNTYGERNTAEIGEKITFQTTITAGGNDSNFILHDKMDKHLTWLGGGNITRDGNLLNRGTSAADAKDYYVDEQPDDGCTFHVIFSESLTNSLHQGATLVVNYYAVLTADADCEHDHENETWLTYTAQNVPSNKDSTFTNTYKVVVNKVDQDGEPLAGATFVLKDNINKYYSWGTVDLGDGKTTEGVVWVDAQSQATAKTTGEDGVIEFKGLDAENFTLVETVVPGGYTGAGEISVSTKTGTNAGAATVEVQNVLGNALPETGGMGTTMFYVIGGLMAAAAVVMLITKKRATAK